MASHQSIRSSNKCVALLVMFLVTLLSLLVVPCQAQDNKEYNISWTPEEVKRYNSTHPLQVKVDDTLRLLCSPEGNYSYANVWIHQHVEQYNQCDCMAIGGANCDPASIRNGFCIPGINPEIMIKIRHNDANLDTVTNFIPGRTYYFQSYSFNDTLISSTSDISMGGHCLQGLKLALTVAEIPTLPPSISPSHTAVPVTVADSLLARSSSDYSYSIITPTETVRESVVSVSETPLIGIASSRRVKDWHVAVIAVLGGTTILGSFLAIVVITIVICYRKRTKSVISVTGISETGKKESSPGETIKKDKIDLAKMNAYVDVTVEKEKPKYPQIFHDPLN